MAEQATMSRDEAIEKDMARVKKDCTEEEIMSCHTELIQVKLSKSTARTATLQLGFPKNYPDDPLFVEVKGKALPTTLAIKLTGAIEQACGHVKGGPQVHTAITTMRGFIDTNLFLPAFDELNTIRNKLVPNKDDIQVHQKKGTLKLMLRHGKLPYFLHVSLAMPPDYPEHAPQLELLETNFKQSFSDMFMAQTRELARRLVEPPAMPPKNAPPFKIQPSLLPMVKNLLENGVQRYPDECCPLCKKKIFPQDPEDQVDDADESRKGDRTMRIYCGHLYHFRCINKYMTTPPFRDGKDCKGKFCGKKIFHKQWTSDVALAEKRWAHLQARKRELDEVVEFLNIADEHRIDQPDLGED